MSAALSLALLTLLLAGCGGGEGTKSGETGETGETGKDQKMVLKFWSFYPDKTNIDGYAMNYLRNKFNIDVEFITSTGEAYKEKLQLDISSGNIPDWWKDLSFTDYDRMVSQSVVAEIPEDLLAEHAPNYMKWLKENTGMEDPLSYIRRDGKVYAMPDLWTLGTNAEVIGLREDWLNKVGITKMPETIEEYEIALGKFRNDDPDGNGKKDTYGLTGTASGLGEIFTTVFGAFGVYPGAFVEKDGTIILGEIEPGAKEALTVLNRWYTNELIDPEFVVNKPKNRDDKIINEKAGAVEYAWWEFIPREAFYSGLFHDKIKEKNGDVSWAISAGPKGPRGESGTTQGNPFSSSGIMFGKHLENDRDKMIKYIQIFNDTAFNFETQANMKYGEKDKTYKVTEDGSYEFIPPYDKEEEQIKFGVGNYYSASGSFNDYELQKPFMTKKSLQPVREKAEAVGQGKYDVLQPVHKPIFNEYSEQLNQFATQSFIDFITGRKPLSEFDSYVEEWKKMGGSKVMEEAQQKYDELSK